LIVKSGKPGMAEQRIDLVKRATKVLCPPGGGSELRGFFISTRGMKKQKRGDKELSSNPGIKNFA
jgi:hypothetical protein